MAIYSDLLFAVSGDPIDVRASIYEKYKIKKTYVMFFFFCKRLSVVLKKENLTVIATILFLVLPK
jgi:hypothetical protein